MKGVLNPVLTCTSSGEVQSGDPFSATGSMPAVSSLDVQEKNTATTRMKVKIRDFISPTDFLTAEKCHKSSCRYIVNTSETHNR